MSRPDTPPPLLVVVGPTASGKSTLAARLGARLGGEVISADSVQVYRHFNIGAGKPNADELALCPHHLIDIREPDELLEASAWADLALETIEDVRRRGLLPIVCGGTFLWVRALIFGLAEAPSGSEEVRARHRKLEQEEGRAHLHQMLAQVDPSSAERLHPNDFVRVSRALEVFELSGRPLSAIQAEHGFSRPRFSARLLGLDWERAAFERRIFDRVGKMLEAGLVEEVCSLLERGFGSARAMSSVGYRQVQEWLKEEASPPKAELHQKIDQVTRIFARRQRTWLRDEKVELISPEALVDDRALEAEVARLSLA